MFKFQVTNFLYWIYNFSARGMHFYLTCPFIIWNIINIIFEISLTYWVKFEAKFYVQILHQCLIFSLWAKLTKYLTRWIPINHFFGWKITKWWHCLKSAKMPFSSKRIHQTLPYLWGQMASQVYILATRLMVMYKSVAI